jgi:hypothetical protein
MTKIVNLRQARKAKARAAKEDLAAQNRATFGVPKHIRGVTKARSEKSARDHDATRLDPDKPLESEP